MARLTLLNDEAITAAGTFTSTPISGLGDVGDILVLWDWDYGSGGTALKAYLQTSLDGGGTWIDLNAFAPPNSDLKKLFDVNAGSSIADNYSPTDGTLTDNTTVDGIIGDQVRVKWVVTGTYVASTLTVYAETKTGVGGGSAALDAASLAALETVTTVSTVADGADVTQGARADAAWASGAGSVIAILKALHAQNAAIIALLTDIETNTAAP